ncbi:MAG: hypothetical protein AB1806_02035 [Acidobacteriota bacterium]
MVVPAKAPEPTTADALERARARVERARAICDAEPDASFENIWHTLILLEDSPLDRLNRSLIRGRTTTLQR